MGLNQTDWELLNAYADGELDGHQADKLAKRLEAEPALTRALDDIYRAKSQLKRLQDHGTNLQESGNALPPANDSMPSLFQQPRKWGIAASVALFLAMGSLLYGNLTQPDWQNQAQAIHQQFADKVELGSSTDAQPVTLPGSLNGLLAPDLTGARLVLADQTLLDGKDGSGAAFHYLGRNGCRLTLIARAHGGEDAQTGEEITRGHQIRLWQQSGHQFTLISKGMYSKRLNQITATLKQDFARQLAPEKPLLAQAGTIDNRPCA